MLTTRAALVQQWQSLVGADAVDSGIKLTAGMLRRWARTKTPQLLCSFCDRVVALDTRVCPQCHEYKGLLPFIQEWQQPPLHLRLVLEVKYNCGSASADDLRQLLGQMVAHALGHGDLTGETNASVTEHRYQVVTVHPRGVKN